LPGGPNRFVTNGLELIISSPAGERLARSEAVTF
jgi:hypothetical protein